MLEKTERLLLCALQLDPHSARRDEDSAREHYESII